jgi:hypothetical protein
MVEMELGVARGATEKRDRHMSYDIATSPFARCATPPYAAGCFPHASPDLVARAGKQKKPRGAALNSLNSLRKFGAGEGIRTLDPNLGKGYDESSVC